MVLGELELRKGSIPLINCQPTLLKMNRKDYRKLNKRSKTRDI
jgi:hypothetical protein